MGDNEPDRSRTKVDDESLAMTASTGGPGRPGVCPACRQPGHLDVIAPGSNSQFEHCPACSTEWKRLLDDGTIEIIQLSI